MHDVQLHARGPYRIVARPGDPLPFVVLDTAGSPLHADASFDGARAWLDLRDARHAASAPGRPGPRR